VRRAADLTPDVVLMDIRMPLASVGSCDLDRDQRGAQACIGCRFM
jgi:CheY-like chemotaxis protein